MLAEDTRTASVLLNHYGIRKKMLSHHAHNEHQFLSRIIELLQQGHILALICDAGMPGISDPGFLLIRECIRKGITVECLPGPTAFLPALIISGFPCDRFCFEGFLPARKGRQAALKLLAEERRTMVFYESPHRLLKTLRDFEKVFGSDRPLAVSRELTKVYEQTIRGTTTEVIRHFEKHPPRGELVITVSGFQN